MHWLHKRRPRIDHALVFGAIGAALIFDAITSATGRRVLTHLWWKTVAHPERAALLALALVLIVYLSIHAWFGIVLRVKRRKR